MAPRHDAALPARAVSGIRPDPVAARSRREPGFAAPCAGGAVVAAGDPAGRSSDDLLPRQEPRHPVAQAPAPSACGSLVRGRPGRPAGPVGAWLVHLTAEPLLGGRVGLDPAPPRQRPRDVPQAAQRPPVAAPDRDLPGDVRGLRRGPLRALPAAGGRRPLRLRRAGLPLRPAAAGRPARARGRRLAAAARPGVAEHPLAVPDRLAALGGRRRRRAPRAGPPRPPRGCGGVRPARGLPGQLGGRRPHRPGP